MKVVTYSRQTAAPRSGGGQFLTAQLSSSAMMAPSRAAGAAFKSLAQTAGQVADLAFRKAEIDADSQAIQATSAYTVELDDIAQRSLLLSPLQAETAFQRDAALAKKKATVGFNRLATDAFNRRSATPTSTASITFKRTNNARYIDAANAVVRSAIDNAVDVGSNTGLTEAQRLLAVSDSRREINSGLTRRGPDATALSQLSLDEELAENTLASIMNGSSDPLGTAEAFRDGTLSDVVLDNLRLNQTQRDKIANDAFDSGTKLIDVRLAQRKALSDAAAAENTASFQRMIGLDFTDPDLRSVAQTEHERLKRIGYYKNPAAIAAVDKLFDLEAGESVKFVATAESIALQNDLQRADYLNRLEYEDVLAAEGKIPPEFYRQMLTALQTERTQAKNAGIQVFKDVFGYTAKEDESGELAAPAKAAFLFNSRTLSSWVDKNPTAPYYKVIEEAERLVDESREKFQSEMLKFQRNNLNQILSTTAGGIGVNVLSDDVSMPDVIAALNAKIQAIAGDNSKSRLRKTLYRALSEAQRTTALRVFDR